MFDLEKFLEEFFKLPTPAHKKDWIRVYESMAVHTKKADPGVLLRNRRPNETKEVYDYRICNYKPITYGSMNRATDELYRIVNSINYKVNAPENTRNLLISNSFEGMPFGLFIQQTVLRRMIEDPNGLLVWLPPSTYTGDSSEKVVPTPYLVCSEDIHYIDQNVISFLSGENSLVRVGKNDVYEGLVFYIVTTDAFYKLKQIGRKADNKFESELIYEHSMGMIPYCVLGGDKVKAGYYNSFFEPYLAWGDEAVCQMSDFQAIMVMSGFPYIEEFVRECVDDIEPDKSTTPDDKKEESYAAPKYVWRKMVRSPHGTIERRPPGSPDNAFADKELDPNVPSVRFIQADVSTAEHAWKVVKEMIAMAEDSLHLNLGRGYLSGEAKQEDKKSQGAMITKIGDNVFDNLMLNSIVFINAYFNYPPKKEEISIDKPAVYDFKTEQDIAEEMANLKAKGAPSFYLQQASIDLSKKRFSGDKLAQRIFDIILINDPKYTYTPAERQSMVLSGTATKEQIIKSDNIFGILMRIASDIGIDAFIKADNKSIIEKLDKILVDEFYPKKETPIIDEEKDEEEETEA